MEKIEKSIKIPENVLAAIHGNIIKLKGPKGEAEKKLHHPGIKIKNSNEGLQLSSEGNSRNYKKILNTFAAHINNMLKGVTEGFQYELKVCSGHFPMSVSVEHNNVTIKNFLGEKIQRKAKILPGVKVEIKGNDIVVSGVSKEHVGETASNLELSTRITNRDRRVFMDGLWITSKAGKKV